VTDKSATKTRALLHVGCGDEDLSKTPRPFQDGDWHEVRLDIDPARKPDIIGTMTDISAVADKSVDAIYSSHNIEHLYAHEVPTALGEFLRVLKPEGFVVMACPDLAMIAQIVTDNRLADTIY
jgi:predicted SAM-dependent methyltransferase